MNYRRPKFIAANIERSTGINVFDKKRTLEIVDVRSLFCYVLRENFKYKITEIRDAIREFRPYTHATVLYNIKIYATDVRYRRLDLEELRLELINQYSPYFIMLNKVKSVDNETIMFEIINLIQEYETTQQKRADLCNASCL